MRGWVAISVTATPAAALRRIREVLRIIIREPPGRRLRPTMALIDLHPVLTDTCWFAPPALVTADWAPPPSTATGSPVTTNCPTRISVPSQQSRHDIRWPPLDEGPPIEQAEQSKPLSHWQRYFANDAESEWAAREMQVPCGRRHVDDFTHM